MYNLPQLLFLLQSAHLGWISDLDFVVITGADSGLGDLDCTLQIGPPYTIHVPKTKHKQKYRWVTSHSQESFFFFAVIYWNQMIIFLELGCTINRNKITISIQAVFILAGRSTASKQMLLISFKAAKCALLVTNMKRGGRTSL